jgi:histidyl-tRNA synthetase
MYTFQDRGGRSITLRPEGTASVVRAYVQNNLHTLSSPQKYYYSGPMFRYERPQKGRFRQFHQIGVEAFGENDPRIDAEIFFMLKLVLEKIGLENLSFEINSIGCLKCRDPYRNALIDFLKSELDNLCSDCKRRYSINPLRVLDCKVEDCQEVKGRTPQITEYLCNECREHFDALLSYLNLLKIDYGIKPEMVRGLDYYTRTTFEVTSQALGAQNAAAAGGRYDNLVEEFGGPPTPAIGFAIGMERLITLLKEKRGIEEPVPDVFVAPIGDEAETKAYKLASEMRAQGIFVEFQYSQGSLKNKLKRADKLKARYAFIIGEEELSKGIVRYKRLSDGKQGELAERDIYKFLGNSNDEAFNIP